MRWAATFFILSATLVAAAPRADAARRPDRLARELQGLRWGATLEQVRENLRRQIERKYRKQLHEAEDVMERRRVQSRMEREFEQLVVGYIAFDGRKTGLEVGIAGEEFRHGSGESVLQVRETDRDRYFFFIGGKLWKLFIVYAASALKGQSFEDFLDRLRERYGPPARVHRRSRPGGQPVPAACQWWNRRTHLEARDRSEFFQSYTLSLSDRRVRKRIADLRARPAARAPDPTDALIEAATGGASPGAAKKPKGKDDGKEPEQKPPAVDIY